MAQSQRDATLFSAAEYLALSDNSNVVSACAWRINHRSHHVRRAALHAHRFGAAAGPCCIREYQHRPEARITAADQLATRNCRHAGEAHARI
jgi:hypothetical protein